MNDLWAAALFAKRVKKDMLITSVCPALIHASTQYEAALQALNLCRLTYPTYKGWLDHDESVMKIKDADIQASGAIDHD